MTIEFIDHQYNEYSDLWGDGERDCCIYMPFEQYYDEDYYEELLAKYEWEQYDDNLSV